MCAFLLFCAGPQAATAGEVGHHWDWLVGQLRSANGIEASLVGFVYTRSEQYSLYEAVIDQGNKAKFLELVQDENAVLRCVGLMALARTEGPATVATLRKHLSDYDTVGYQVYDMGSQMTVAEFALNLLGDANWLDVRKPHKRSNLLSAREAAGLYIEILADDTAALVHRDVAVFFRGAFKRTRLTLDLATLRQLSPSLQDWQIVKGIGRMKLSEATQGFLIDCLADESLAAAARFAAASALTRHTDRASIRALHIHRETLNRLDDARWGDVFIATLNTRRGHEKSMRHVAMAKSAPNREKMNDRIMRAYTCDHPLALGNLLNPPRYLPVVKGGPLHETIVESVMAIAENLDRCQQPWSTYSDTAFKLDVFLAHRRLLERLADESEKARIEELSLLSRDQRTHLEHTIGRFISR